MLDDDIQKLSAQPPLRSLARLDSDIWACVEARVRAKRVSRIVYACQAAVLALGMLGSIAAGTRIAAAANAAGPQDILSMRTGLSPAAKLGI